MNRILRLLKRLRLPILVLAMLAPCGTAGALTLVWDTFTDAYGTSITSHTPDIGPAYNATGISQPYGSGIYEDNAYKTIILNDDRFVNLYIGTPVNPVTYQMDLTRTSETTYFYNTHIGVQFRWQDSSNFFMVFFDQSNTYTAYLQFRERIAASDTTIASYWPPTTGQSYGSLIPGKHALKVVESVVWNGGTTISVYFNFNSTTATSLRITSWSDKLIAARKCAPQNQRYGGLLDNFLVEDSTASTPTPTPTPNPTAILGVTTDLHHRTVTSNQCGYLADVHSCWNYTGTTAAIYLGDMIGSSTNRADCQIQIGEINSVISGGYKSYWTRGNHDTDGAGVTRATWLADRVVYAPKISDGDTEKSAFDLGNWKIISIDAVQAVYFSADTGNLDFLDAQMELARLAGKYILIATHPLIWKDYPGADTLYGGGWTTPPTEINTDGTTVTGNVSPSAISGTIDFTSTASDFVAGDIGRYVIARGTGSVWGVAIITAITTAQIAVCNVIVGHEFPDINSIATGNWGFGTPGHGYSLYAFNAKKIRGNIEAAAAGGANVKIVICGHGHVTASATVNSIYYQEFPTTHNSVKAYNIILNTNGTYGINGPLATPTPSISGNRRHWWGRPFGWEK